MNLLFVIKFYGKKTVLTTEYGPAYREGANNHSLTLSHTLMQSHTQPFTLTLTHTHTHTLQLTQHARTHTTSNRSLSQTHTRARTYNKKHNKKQTHTHNAHLTQAGTQASRRQTLKRHADVLCMRVHTGNKNKKQSTVVGKTKSRTRKKEIKQICARARGQ